jgi:hypothetical protein
MPVSVLSVGLGLLAYGMVFALASGMTHFFETLIAHVPLQEKLYSWLAYAVVMFVVTFGVIYAALRAGDPIVI